ncbi:hypothetical protein EDC01DRAFT_653734 [Geopyxis carbonaria]|nr:hypothetical protein EDC01DRAFT_653734 [Geopyxis carbonaria]
MVFDLQTGSRTAIPHSFFGYTFIHSFNLTTLLLLHSFLEHFYHFTHTKQSPTSKSIFTMQFTTLLIAAISALTASALPTSKPQDAPASLCQPRLDPQWAGGNISSCKAGQQEASSYTAVPMAGCGIDFAPGALVAAYYMDLDANPNMPNPHCGKTITVTNAATQATVDVLIVDTCPTCSGVAGGVTGQWANFNGATIDLSESAFTQLFNGETSGVFDVSYEKLSGGDVN